MGKRFENLKNTFSDTKARVTVVVILATLVIASSMGYLQFRSRIQPEAAAGGAAVSSAPNIVSIPGVGDPSRQYVKLQEQQNIQQSDEALQKNTAAIPTITRVTYLDSGVPSTSGKDACGVEELKRAHAAGVTAAELRCRGCSLAALKAAGFSAAELRAAGFSAKDLKDAGFSAAELRDAGFSAKDLAQAGFSAKELKDAGFSAAELKNAGFSTKDLAQAGFSAKELRDAGFSAAELKNAGFSAKDLVAAGFSANELKNAGFSTAELQAAGMTAANAEKGKCDVESLKEAHNRGISAAALKDRGCSVAALKAAGFTARELRDAGFSAAELRGAGFSAAELKDAGFSAKELKDAGFSAAELKDAGFSAKDLKDAGFSAKELKNAGFSAAELKDAGFSPSELKKAGFTNGDLIRAGFSAADINDENVTAPVFSQKGSDIGNDCSIAALQRARDAGLSAKVLKDRGCSLAALKAAGFSAAELKAAGFSAAELKAAGFSAAELKGAGFSAQELKDAGFSDDELINAGFSPDELSKVVQNQSAIASMENKTSWQEQIERMRKSQEKQLSAQEYQDKTRQLQQGMASQAGELFGAWTPLPAQQYVQGVIPSENAGGIGGGGGSGGDKNAADINADIIKAGTVLFAVLDTGINSDEQNTPVMATIIEGDLKGGKVLGSFQRVDKKVLLQFSTLNVPGLSKSISFNAVAIDPNTARTALATNVDNHYMLRYGTLFASSFMSGLGQAIQNSGSQETTTTIGEKQHFWPKLDSGGKALVGLGSVGQKFGDVLSPVFNTPPTVEVKAGSGLGVLLMADLSLPKQQKKGL